MVSAQWGAGRGQGYVNNNAGWNTGVAHVLVSGWSTSNAVGAAAWKLSSVGYVWALVGWSSKGGWGSAGNVAWGWGSGLWSGQKNRNGGNGARGAARIETFNTEVVKPTVTVEQLTSQADPVLLSDGIAKFTATFSEPINISSFACEDITITGSSTDIFGIWKDNDSSLDQKISKSVNSGAILTIATDNDFITANTSTGRTSLTDWQYLVIWSNWWAIATQVTELDTGLYTNRAAREWRVENTNSVWTINMNFDGFDDNYVLLTDSDGDFSAGAINEGALSASGTISLTLDDGKYFTLASPITNLPPTDISLSWSGNIDENSASWTVIWILSTTDLDIADTHTYSFVAWTGATDNASFSLSGSTLILNISPDYETQSSYSVLIQTDDANWGTYEEIFIISINDVDEIAPVITLVGSWAINHEAYTLYSDGWATANDNEDGDITLNIISAGSVDTSTLGSYTITYDVTDSNGNPAIQVSRDLIIVMQQELLWVVPEVLKSSIQIGMNEHIRLT